jgi:hypothetical protein
MRSTAHPARTLIVPQARSTVVFVGLKLEARIAIASGGEVLCHDRQCDPLELISRSVQSGCRSIISFGLAGGLAPGLQAGDWIVASSILCGNERFATDAIWSARLLLALPQARYAPILGSDSAVTQTPARGDLHAHTGAAVVDNESHLVGKAAAMHSLRFAALRVVVDAIHRRIPRAALNCVCADGSVSLPVLLWHLLEQPAESVDVLRLAGDWLAAKASLSAASAHLSLGCDEAHARRNPSKVATLVPPR